MYYMYIIYVDIHLKPSYTINLKLSFYIIEKKWKYDLMMNFYLAEKCLMHFP